MKVEIGEILEENFSAVSRWNGKPMKSLDVLKDLKDICNKQSRTKSSIK